MQSEREQIHNEIAARITAFLFSKNKFLLLKLPTGSGKTTTALKTLKEFEDINWIYLAPFHHVIVENLEMSQYARHKYIHLKSRAKTCIIPQWRRLAEVYHINIRPICENTCPRKDDGCPYYDAKRELRENPGNWAGVHHHINDFLGDFLDSWDNDNRPMRNNYELLIIDENPINVLFINRKTDDTKLLYLKHVIDSLNISHPSLQPCINFINYLINTFTGKALIDYDMLYDLMNAVDFTSFYDVYQIELLENVIAERIKESDIPPDYIEWFAKIQQNMTREKLEQMIVKKEASGYTHKHYYLMCFEEAALRNLPLKIIGLDGTANVDIWETMIGEKASIFERRYKHKNMYQLTCGEYPLSSWLEPHTYKMRSTGKRLCLLIDMIAAKKQYKVLVICTNALRAHIRKQTKAKNLIYGTYYYLRSRNDFYKVADTVILAIQPNIPQFQIECFARLSNWGTDIWRQVFTDEEMVQGVGRNRGDIDIVYETMRKREPRETYIFPAPRSENYPEHHIVDVFGEWAHKLTYEQMYNWLKFGILPENRFRDEVLNLIEVNGTWETDLFRSFHKCNKNYNKISFKQKLRELKKQGLIDYAEGKQRKIYKRLSNTTKRE